MIQSIVAQIDLERQRGCHRNLDPAHLRYSSENEAKNDVPVSLPLPKHSNDLNST